MNITLHVYDTNVETRNNIPYEVNEMSVPGTYFDRQRHTHHNKSLQCLYFVGEHA